MKATFKLIPVVFVAIFVSPIATAEGSNGTAVMTALTPENNGQFMDYQGNPLPW